MNSRSAGSPSGKIRHLYRSGLLRLAIEGQIGNWIANVGQALGSERLMFNHFMFSGFHRGALETAPAAVESVLALLPDVRSVVDYGCGTGVYLSEFARRGLAVRGFEYSPRARAMAEKLYGLQVSPFDLNSFSPDTARYDLSICIEVAHYLPAALGDQLVQLCAAAAPRVLFSAAHPGQHGFGHINAQPRDYWIERFSSHGYTLNREATEAFATQLRHALRRGFWLADNAFIVERAP